MPGPYLYETDERGHKDPDHSKLLPLSAWPQKKSAHRIPGSIDRGSIPWNSTDRKSNQATSRYVTLGREDFVPSMKSIVALHWLFWSTLHILLSEALIAIACHHNHCIGPWVLERGITWKIIWYWHILAAELVLSRCSTTEHNSINRRPANSCPSSQLQLKTSRYTFLVRDSPMAAFQRKKSPSPAENCQLPLPFSAVQSCNSARAKMSRSPLLPKQLQSSPSTHRRIIYSSGTMFLVFFYTGTILPSALTVAPLLTWEICPKAVTNKLLRARIFFNCESFKCPKMVSLNSKHLKSKKAPQKSPELGSTGVATVFGLHNFETEKKGTTTGPADHCPADISSSLGPYGHHNSPN